MLHNFFSQLNIGSMRVNTTLFNENVRLGDVLKGVIEIENGEEEENISSIYLYFWTSIGVGKEAKKYVLSKNKLSEQMIIQPNEKKEIPFELRIPYNLPISTENQEVYLNTGLTTDDLPNPKDTDPVTILPDRLESKLLDEIANLGLSPTSNNGQLILYDENNELFSHFDRSFPFVQFFEFSGGKKFDNFQLFLDIQEKKVNILIRTDTKPHNLKTFLNETFNRDISFYKLTTERNKILTSNLLSEHLNNIL